MKIKTNKIKIILVSIIIILIIILCIYYRRNLLNQNKWEGAKEYLDEYGIHINNVQLEYIFLKKSNKIVPILRLNGMMRGLEDGDIKLSFWTWILDE